MKCASDERDRTNHYTLGTRSVSYVHFLLCSHRQKFQSRSVCLSTGWTSSMVHITALLTQSIIYQFKIMSRSAFLAGRYWISKEHLLRCHV